MGRVLDPKVREAKIEKVKELLSQGMGIQEIADKLKITAVTIYKWRSMGKLGEYKKTEKKPNSKPEKSEPKPKIPKTPATMLTQSLVELMRQVVREELSSMFSRIKK